jgi:hypothetical protein
MYLQFTDPVIFKAIPNVPIAYPIGFTLSTSLVFMQCPTQGTAIIFLWYI